jgi:transposase
MRFVGIDIGGERHALAVVDEDGTVLTKSTFFGEEAAGYNWVREPAAEPARNRYQQARCLTAIN